MTNELDLVNQFKSQLGDAPENIADLIIRQNTFNGINIEIANKLKTEIGNFFSIPVETIYIVGSAKLGFSISEKKDYNTDQIIKPRYRPFGLDSDVDIAIVNSQLFDSFWEEIFKVYCEDFEWGTSHSFQKYFFHGWIRPDKFPSGTNFPDANSWWKFFADLSRNPSFGRRRICAGLYKSINFLKKYQEVSVKECINEIKLGGGQ